MNIADIKLKELLETVLDEGIMDMNPRPYWEDEDGKRTPAHSLFTTQYVETFDISKGEFPITTIKPTAWKTGIREMFWIYQEASNDLQVARDKFGIKWWDSWDIGDGTIGSTYGAIVDRLDLMQKLLSGIIRDPYGRRHIMSLWQEDDLRGKIGLPPCAFQTLWTVRGEYLDCTLIQRSQDVLGANNINNIQYVALMMMVAHHCGLKPGKFTHFIQNVHIYDRHIPIAKEFLERPISEKQPKLIFNPKSDNFYGFTIDDFSVVDYEPQEKVFIQIAI
jgi:thymidylate synthase